MWFATIGCMHRLSLIHYMILSIPAFIDYFVTLSGTDISLSLILVIVKLLGVDRHSISQTPQYSVPMLISTSIIGQYLDNICNIILNGLVIFAICNLIQYYMYNQAGSSSSRPMLQNQQHEPDIGQYQHGRVWGSTTNIYLYYGKNIILVKLKISNMHLALYISLGEDYAMLSKYIIKWIKLAFINTKEVSRAVVSTRHSYLHCKIKALKLMLRGGLKFFRSCYIKYVSGRDGWSNLR